MSRTQLTVLALGVFLATFLWIGDATLDYLYFYRGQGFWELTVKAVPQHEMYVRSLVAAVVIGFAVVVSLLVGRLDRQKRQNSDLAAIVKSSQDAIFMTDPQGRVLTRNRRAQDVFCLEPNQIDGSDLFAILNLDSLGDLCRAMERVGGMEQVEPIETVHHRTDGQDVHVSVQLTAIEDHGRVRAISAVFRNITRRIEAERRQKEANDRLRHRQQLETIGTLAGGVAHDFNNQLTVIRGYSDMLLTGQLDDHQQDMVQQIVHASRRAHEVTRQLLAFSRRQLLQPEKLDVNAVIESLVKPIRRLLGEQILLELYLTNGPMELHVDKSQLEQAIFNVLINGRDAIDGDGRITISTRPGQIDQAEAALDPELRAGPCMDIEITDSGRGMDAETVEMAFEPFFTTKPQGLGTGLGLAMVYGFVKQSRGKIQIRSSPSEGTTVTISLPQAGADDEEAPDLIDKQIAQAAGHETILLAEDDPHVRGLIRRTLERSGFHVLAAESPEEALRIEQEYDGPIHLLITDVIMPTMTGPVLADQIKQNCKDIEVLYISGYSGNELGESIPRNGGVNLLRKPFSAEQISSAARKVLDTGSLESDPPGDKARLGQSSSRDQR